MLKKTQWVLLFIWSGFALAQDGTGNQYSQSIMFQAPPSEQALQLNLQNDERSKVCQDLKQQIKDLQGKPVRQNVLKERFQTEWVGNH
jgi:TolA-binding protein